MKRLYAFCPFCLKSCFVLIYRVSAQIITLIISSEHFQNQNLLFLFTCILSLSCHWNLSSITEGTVSVQLTVLPSILKWSMTYVQGAQQIFVRWMHAKYIFNLITFSFSFFFSPMGLSSTYLRPFSFAHSTTPADWFSCFWAAVGSFPIWTATLMVKFLP